LCKSVIDANTWKGLSLKALKSESATGNVNQLTTDSCLATTNYVRCFSSQYRRLNRAFCGVVAPFTQRL